MSDKDKSQILTERLFTNIVVRSHGPPWIVPSFTFCAHVCVCVCMCVLCMFFLIHLIFLLFHFLKQSVLKGTHLQCLAVTKAQGSLHTSSFVWLTAIQYFGFFLGGGGSPWINIVWIPPAMQKVLLTCCVLWKCASLLALLLKIRRLINHSNKNQRRDEYFLIYALFKSYKWHALFKPRERNHQLL